MKKQTVKDIDLKGKRIVIRVDYNVPVKDGQVTDAFRIESSLPTLRYLLEQGCAIVVLSHLGEPKNGPEAKFSLKPVAEKAATLIGQPVAFYDDCIGEDIMEAATSLKPGEVIMGENVRFHPEELANDAAYAKKLASLGEVYVNDAFAVDHRAQASVSGIAEYLPAVAGFLVEKEVDYITGALESPKRPLVAIIGGAKVSSKIEVLSNLLPKVDVLIIGGAMANTFYLAQGLAVGKSLVEPDFVETAKQLMEQAKRENTELIYPTKVVVSKSLDAPEDVRTVDVAEVGETDIIVDAAPGFGQVLTDAVFEFLDYDNIATVIWNGPIGVTEVADFAAGSLAIARAIIALPNVVSIIGGGDTAGFVDGAKLHDKFTWVSTGGGASLELMSGKKLPGVEALLDKR